MLTFSPTELQNAKNFKFAGKDSSILVNFGLGYFWDLIVKKLPLSLAPNILTATSLVLEVLEFLIVFASTRYMIFPPPNWVCIFSGIVTLIYQLLDNIDGRQARRANCATCLGHFFDQTSDSIILCLEAMNFCAVANFSISKKTFYFVLLTQTLSYLSSWEEFLTHKFNLSAINELDEGLFLIAIIKIIIGFIPSLRPYVQTIWFILLLSIFFVYRLCTVLISVIKEYYIAENTFIYQVIDTFVPLLMTIIIFGSNIQKMAPGFLDSYFILFTGCLLSFQKQLLVICTLTKKSLLYLYNPVILFEWLGGIVSSMHIPDFPMPRSLWFFAFWLHYIIILIYVLRTMQDFINGLGIPFASTKIVLRTPAHPDDDMQAIPESLSSAISEDLSALQDSEDVYHYVSSSSDDEDGHNHNSNINNIKVDL